MSVKRKPVALTIAGMDSSGGAGVTLDLATFEALGVRGKSVVTAITAQSVKAVHAVQGTRPALITAQLEAAFSERRPQAAKCGMLYSAGVVEAVADFWSDRRVPLVIDPVLASSSRTALLNPSGVRSLKRHLLPMAKLATPNVPEAEALTGLVVKNPETMQKAARAIYEQYGCAVIVTGGHMKGTEIVEVFFDGRKEWLLTTPRLTGGPWRGTGCRFASAVTANLAKGTALSESTQHATRWVSGQLKRIID